MQCTESCICKLKKHKICKNDIPANSTYMNHAKIVNNYDIFLLMGLDFQLDKQILNFCDFLWSEQVISSTIQCLLSFTFLLSRLTARILELNPFIPYMTRDIWTRVGT